MSQYNEHEFILQHFAGRTGRFLDVGAFDGVINSNTRCLADAGWSGVCVEPSPPAFCRLMQNYYGNDKVTLVCAAVGAENPGWFRCNTETGQHCDQLSTFSEEHSSKWLGHPFRSIIIAPMSWERLLYALPHGSPFDFVNIDVEGTNLEVLRNMPFLPEMVCVELDPREAVLEAVKARYLNHQVIGGNVLGWR